MKQTVVYVFLAFFVGVLVGWIGLARPGFDLDSGAVSGNATSNTVAEAVTSEADAIKTGAETVVGDVEADVESAAETLSNRTTQGGAFVANDQDRLPGIDVSHFQGDVDWGKVRDAGMAFAYAKATQGITYVDPKYAENQSGAVAADLPFGAYHYFEPEDDVQAQVEHFLNTANITKGSLPPVLDVEHAVSKGEAKVLAKDVVAWLSAVNAATKCQPILYSGRSYYNSYLESVSQDTRLWLAEYSQNAKLPQGVTAWVFWQHTQSGSVDGIAGAVDLDYFAGSNADLMKIRCR